MTPPMGAQYISHDLNHVFDVVDVNVGSWELIEAIYFSMTLPVGAKHTSNSVHGGNTWYFLRKFS